MAIDLLSRVERTLKGDKTAFAQADDTASMKSNTTSASNQRAPAAPQPQEPPNYSKEDVYTYT